jgi:hypothetical protein
MLQLHAFSFSRNFKESFDYAIKLSSLMAAVRTMLFNIQYVCILSGVYLCVSHVSQNKQQLFY